MPAALLDHRPQITDDATRREFLLGATAAGLVVGCATKDTGDDDDVGTAPTRRVTDLAGRVVDVPVDPQRIVTIDPSRTLSDLVALGFVPVGAAEVESNPDGRFPPTVTDVADDIASVGALGTVDLERVVGLRPDLIFISPAHDNSDVDTLSEVAPVVVIHYELISGLFEPLRWLAGILDVAPLAAGIENEILATIENTSAWLSLAGRPTAVVNLINYEPGPNVLVFGRGLAATEFLELLGVRIVPEDVGGEAVPEGGAVPVSIERLADALADVDLVVGLFYGGNEANLDERLSSPLWSAIPAVARGDVVVLNVDEAGANYGIADLEDAVEDLADQLAR